MRDRGNEIGIRERTMRKHYGVGHCYHGKKWCSD